MKKEGKRTPRRELTSYVLARTQVGQRGDSVTIMAAGRSWPRRYRKVKRKPSTWGQEHQSRDFQERKETVSWNQCITVPVWYWDTVILGNQETLPYTECMPRVYRSRIPRRYLHSFVVNLSYTHTPTCANSTCIEYSSVRTHLSSNEYNPWGSTVHLRVFGY